MNGEAVEVEVVWEGPYAWPGFEAENGMPSLPGTAGVVYLQTFEYGDGYLIYAAGITRRSGPTRFREHTRSYKKGEYNVLDMDAIRRGLRKEVWHGWEYARTHKTEFEARKPEILDAVRRQLAEFRIFVANVGKEPRVLERLEAAIMENLYRQPSPICDIPDRGMHLLPRWSSEKVLVARNRCASVLYGLPPLLEI